MARKLDDDRCPYDGVLYRIDYSGPRGVQTHPYKPNTPEKAKAVATKRMGTIRGLGVWVRGDS